MRGKYLASYIIFSYDQIAFYLLKIEILIEPLIRPNNNQYIKFSFKTFSLSLSKMNSFSTQQIQASNEVIGIFEASMYRWGMLLAQMQSGKTETYLRIACEMLQKNLVSNVVIFSGNSETELGDQVYENVKELERNAKKPETKSSSFWPKYLKSKENEFPEAYREFILQGIKATNKAKITVVWGTELLTFQGPFENTLFIWDEAHFAQSVNQRPDKFLKKIGISANGNSNDLKTKNNYMLTVSATPFSELSDYLHLHQEKFYVKMLPGDNYVSVKIIRDSGRLITYTNLEDGLSQALRIATDSTEKKYCVIRISKKTEDLVFEKCLENGWKVYIYDSLDKSNEMKEKVKKIWNSMGKAPKFNTAILIREKCRMGKNMQKSHLSFVFETASSSSTDTILQGLLGRTCGYSDGSDRVKVYISKKIYNENKLDNDINRYIELWDNNGISIIPRKANNLGSKLLSENEPIIPIRIKRSNLDNDRKQVISDVLNAFHRDQTRIENKNIQQNFDFKNIRVFYLDESKKTRGTDKAYAIESAFNNGIAKGFGSGAGAVDGEVNIWCPKRIPNFDTQYLYVTLTVLNTSIRDENKIPKTTKNEIFAHSLENGEKLEANGGFTYNLPKETSVNEELMLDEIKFLIGLTTNNMDRNGFSSSINSCWDANDACFKGILVNDAILHSLEENGNIYENIKNNLNKTLKIEKTSERYENLNRLMSISW